MKKFIISIMIFLSACNDYRYFMEITSYNSYEDKKTVELIELIPDSRNYTKDLLDGYYCIYSFSHNMKEAGVDCQQCNDQAMCKASEQMTALDFTGLYMLNLNKNGMWEYNIRFIKLKE